MRVVSLICNLQRSEATGPEFGLDYREAALSLPSTAKTLGQSCVWIEVLI
jgi:hypothetical protein